jgi:uncharacterized membrane protein YczE
MAYGKIGEPKMFMELNIILQNLFLKNQAKINHTKVCFVLYFFISMMQQAPTNYSMYVSQGIYAYLKLVVVSVLDF